MGLVGADSGRSIADVHVGRDGWLFLIGGRNRPLRFFRRSLRRSWLLARWARLVRARARRAAGLGIAYLHVPVPEKLAVYADMTGLAYDPALSLAHALAGRIADGRICVDLVPDLLAAKRATQVFSRTDTHWTSTGCRVALEAICDAVEAEPGWDLADRPSREIAVAGDLGSRFDPPPVAVEPRTEVLRDAHRLSAHPLVRRFEERGRGHDLHRGAAVVYRNPSVPADPRRLLVFGDSYAHFVDYQLTGMLAETFREVNFVWSSSLDWGLVERLRPDILVTEIAERFMARVPADDFDHERFAAERLAAVEAEG